MENGYHHWKAKMIEETSRQISESSCFNKSHPERIQVFYQENIGSVHTLTIEVE
ncbi:MAG: hypothetical protein IIB39_04780 [Candidatus Marinimicrobia bacterium]|nr:hypothetical protein [Candidatus Neomarinimicrobiota bacterium]